MSVNYKDVLDQAVDNEHWRTLREIRDQLARIQFSEPRNSWDSQPRSDYKRLRQEVLDVVDRKLKEEK